MRSSLPFLCLEGEGEAAGTAPGQAAPRAALIWWCSPRQGCLHEHPSNPPCITQPSPSEKRLIFPAQPARTKTSIQLQNERRKRFSPSCK